jgi:hypothetical protein
VSRRWDARRDADARLAAERGTIRREAATRIALCYPSPYRAAMSSLGYQQIYRLLNEVPDVAADRAMLPDDVEAARRPAVAHARAVAPGGQLPAAGVLGRLRARDPGPASTCLALANIPVLADAIATIATR